MSSDLYRSKVPYAVLVGLDCITGLQAARLLARHGIPVIGIANDAGHFCCRTKACERIVCADIAAEELIHTLEAVGTCLNQKAVLFPCTDISVLQISRHHDRLAQWFHIALPDRDVVEMLLDKRRFHGHAKKQGWLVPATFFLDSRRDAEEAAESLKFPCILKPPVKTSLWQKHSRAKVYMVSSSEQLLTLYDRCSQWSDTLMIQEWIGGADGDLYSCNCYFTEKSVPLTTFVARKIRQWPPEIGTSSLGEECRNDIVLQTAIELFQRVGYHGLGYVEMKRDKETGKYFIIEANVGRPTGRSAIAEAGGVELLYAKYCDKAGQNLPEQLKQKYRGVKWVYLRHDIQSALHYWRRGELSFKQWWHSWSGPKAYAVFSWSDPAPFWCDLKKAVRQLFRNNRPECALG